MCANVININLPYDNDMSHNFLSFKIKNHQTNTLCCNALFSVSVIKMGTKLCAHIKFQVPT